jgi:membrane protein required for colicin V production
VTPWRVSEKDNGNEELRVTLFDLIAVLILGVSALVGFVRGATREMMTVVAFILAVLISVFALRFSGPIFRHSVHPDWLANTLAILVIFIAAYLIVRLLGGMLTRGIHKTQTLGTADRVIGVGFGLIRAMVLLGVFYLAFTATTPTERVPHWISGAALYPLAGVSAKMITALAPQGSAVAGKVAPALEKAVRDGSHDRSPDPGKGTGYDAGSRRSVDALVEKTR